LFIVANDNICFRLPQLLLDPFCLSNLFLPKHII